MEAEPEAGSVSVPSEPPMPPMRPAPVTNALLLGQQLAEALGAARALINRTPTDLAVMVEKLRRWYYAQHPDERERLLWERSTEAKQTHARLQHTIEVVREALEVERPALVQSQAEREALATRPLPATIEEEASGIRADTVRRYQSVGIECQQRAAAIAELEHLRSRLERLRAEASAHAAEIEEWSQQVGRPLRIPRIVFPWPPAPVWQALLGAPAEAPELRWDDDPQAPSV